MRPVLFALLLTSLVTATRKHQIHDPGILEFSSSLYNLSISEKWTVNATAWSDSPERVGAFVPYGHSIKFKIVKGDKDQFFIPIAKKVGNFAFLSIGVKSNEILNRELQPEFELVIKATARRKNEATQEAQSTVYLKIIDDNDLFPFFTESQYSASIDDQLPVNSKILKLEGVDADVGLNGQIYYSLLSPSDYFYVEPLTGWVRTYSRLHAGTYNLKCQVEDRASRLFYQQRDPSLSFFRNQVTLTVTVTPSDNRPPKLSAQPIPLRFYTVHEQPAALLTISSDSLNQNVNVELSGEVQLRGDTFLRRQSANTFMLSVARVTNSAPGPISLIVRDLSQPNGTFTAENIPLEMNTNERRVWFDGATDEDTPRISLKINESAPIDYLFYIFNANTTFEEDKKNLKYRIHGKESQKLPFHLDKSTGQLRVKSKLSHSEKALYEISVVAKLEGVEEKAFVDVFVEILDSNNNCPVFKSLPNGYQLKLKTKSVGTEVYKVYAEDADIGENGQVTYKLIGVNGSDSYFSIDPLKGNIKIAKELSASESKWAIKIMAIDSGWPLPNFATVLLQIVYGEAKPIPENLFDTCYMKNENAPKFVHSKSTFEVNENVRIGHQVGFVKAIDSDFGYNGLIGYTTTDPFFGIDLYSGRLFVQKTLTPLLVGTKKDHLLYEIDVVAHDHAFEAAKTATGKVQIKIMDINNHAPEFEKFSYTVKIAENTLPSEELIRLKATDLDSGSNGRIEYRLTIETDTIFVDPDTGSVRLERALDREQQDKYEFLIMAVDRGKPPKFGFTNLTLIVEDKNDNTPKCGKDLHSANMAEDSPTGQLILCMAVSDSDLAENAKLEFSMSVEDTLFQIDKRTGCIFSNVSKPFDYEAQSVYSFNVTVTDLGVPKLSTTCPVEIHLIDVEENQLPPRFTESVYETSIEENKPKNTEILTVKTIDNTPVYYELVDGDGLGYFLMDKESGILRTASVIDYEQNADFWLTVRAIHRNKKSPLFSYAHIYIRIIDLNDQRPLFSQPIYFPSVVENSEPNKVILRLNATDGDASIQNSALSPIKYTIERGNSQSNFMLDENTGYLVTGRRHLDRETQAQHELYIQACDQGQLCSSVLVVVTVLDQNDNKPHFKESSFNLTVPANQAGFLTRVFADDADEDGPNSDLTYSLENSHDSKITIDKFGRLFATEPLTPNISIPLTVVAEDNGEPRLRSTASVKLTTVAPISKSAKLNKHPTFQNLAHWHHLYLSDNDPVGTMLGRIEATDTDNDPLWFRIVEGSTNPNETFAFQSASAGELVLARRAELIGNHIRKIELTIAVTDGFAEIRDKVFIHVTRSSVARPRFDQNEAFVEIKNDFPIGYVLYTAKAHFDETNTGISHPHNLGYGIHYVTDVLAAESLRIDSSNGKLILEKPLNEAVASNFSVIIVSKIGGGQENFAVVHIHKISTNHAPKFLFDECRLKFVPGINQIGSIFAFDIDSEEDGQVTYSILSGNEDGYFLLDPVNGELTLKNVSSTIQSDFTLTVRATDSSKTSTLSSTCTIYLTKQINETDLVPEFKDVNQIILLDETTKNKQKILVLDSISDSFVSYSSDCDLFDVHFGSGLVKLHTELADDDFNRLINCSFYAYNSMTNKTAKFPIRIKSSRKDTAFIRFEFDQYSGIVKELAPLNSPVFINSTFAAPLILKANSNRPVRYRLLSPQESHFKLEPISGALRVVEPIEMHKNWELSAIAYDNNPSNSHSSQPIQIKIDVLSNKSSIPQINYVEFELLLPTSKDTFIGQIGMIGKYSFKSNNKLFRIDSESGDIFVATNDTNLFNERKYELSVDVNDFNVKVVIKTLSNDQLLRRPNALKLARHQYIVHTTENRTNFVDTQHPILAIDWPLNALNGETFDFRLSTQLYGKLNINPTNGLVYLNASNPLDREKQPKIDVVVLITSRQDTQRYGQVIIHLILDDINDCAPVFEQDEYRLFLSQDAKLADKLVQIKAFDDDFGTNGIVRYLLANDAPEFVEISNDGRLLLKSQPSNEDLSIGYTYSFHVIASDQGVPSLTSKALILMTVVDKNQPLFEGTNYRAVMLETEQIGYVIKHIKARSNTEGEFVYQIIDGNPLKEFEIGFRDGILLLNKHLDYKRQREYQLKVQVTDLSRENASSTTIVSVNIKEANKFVPKFEKEVYKYFLSESAPIDTLIGQLNATNSGKNKIRYQILNGNKTILTVDQLNGQIRLASQLDFERERFLEWTVLVENDDKFADQAIVQLNVIDENDNPPKFVNKSPLYVNIQASEQFNTSAFIHHFKATDLDSVVEFSYSIDDGDEMLFNLDRQTGILTQIRPFDPIELKNFSNGNNVQKELNVSVSDGLFEDRIRVNIVFKPTAAQISPLQFNSLINSVLLNENRLIKNRTIIETLKVNGGRKPYLFSVPPTNGTWPFFVHPTSGHVYLANKLDWKRSAQIVPFTVQDSNQQLAFMRMEVTMKQSNNNVPKFVTFDENGYQLYVSITAAEGDQIAKIVAEDEDEEYVLEYTIIDYEEDSWLNPTKYFVLDLHSGYLSVHAPIPANLVGQQMEFYVKVIDHNNPPHQQKVPFQLSVTDAPVPQLSRLHFYFAVSEESEVGTLVGQLTTSEQSSKDLNFDMHENDENSVFALDKSNGRLTLRSKLDRETKERHQFVIRVKNSDGLASFCFVTINVMDANDNFPRFVTQIERVYVSEDSRIGSIVNVFYAIDADQGVNGQISYKLKAEDDTFRVDSQYGWLFVAKNLDRERQSTYNLTIVAKDGGGFKTEWPFQLFVRDVNDNPPIFEKIAYSLKLKQKDCQIGQKLLRLNVNDADTSEVQNIVISIVSKKHNEILKLVGNDVVFNAFPSTDSSFNTTFQLIAFDGIHSTTSDLNLEWIASNIDFCTENNQTIHIPANRPLNSPILLLNKDGRQVLIHHLIGNEKFPFEIVNNSELVTKEGFYKLPNYKLRIKSIQNWNNIEQSCVRHYNVTIDPANRMAPHFDVRNFTINVPENSNVSNHKRHFLTRLPATDEDYGYFGTLTYSLERNESTPGADQYFEVHESTGAILLKKPLDRESQEKFDLKIKVEDGGGLNDYANLSVIVENVNDNVPVFEKTVYHLKVLENEAIGYVLLKVIAHDSDVSDQKLAYELKDSKAREFVELNAESGILRLIQSFDYEKIQNLTFDVFVRDNGNPPLESKAIVEIEVLDLNDNSPRFEHTLYESSVMENAKIGTKILKVSAIDNDSEHFGKISYSLTGEDADFLAVTDSGWVELAKSLDYESKKLLRANVKAIDGGVPALSDETLLSITIQDYNEHPPQFADCKMSAVIQEGVQAGQSLLTVQLTDADSAANGAPFRLEIRGDGASAFTFDPMLNLITTRQLSYTEQREFHLNVTAFDVHGLNTTCPLTVSVKKQSRHAPEVNPLLITINSLYGEFLGSKKIGRIRAVDKDQGDLLRFSIIESVNHAPSSLSFDHSKLQSTVLHVDAATGELALSADLLLGLHRFNISVTDGKFVVSSPVTIDVSNIDQEALDNSISVQLSGMTAEKFAQEHMQKFIGVLSRILSVPTPYVRIISIQDVEKSAQSKREINPTVIAFPPQISNSEIELLLTVSRGESRGYHRPSFVKQRISEGIAQLTAESGLEVTSLTSEVCRSDTCSNKGDCRDRLWLDNVDLLHINDEKNGNSYLFPKFVRTYECICRQGFGGQDCAVAVNKCSREMCSKYEMCVPNDSESVCICPPGLQGDRCAVSMCDKPSECSQKESISLMGNGYFRLFIAQSVEARMELLVEFKTISRNAYLMHGAGPKDFHSILIEEGFVEYRWDCGTGIGRAKISHIRVDDGQFHNLKIVRRGRQVKLILDNHQAEAASPPGSDVVNLYEQATILTFGAQVRLTNQHHRHHHYGRRQSASELTTRIENGTIGCFGRIGVDGFDLPKSEQGLRMFNAKVGCDAQTIGVCLNAPCLNNGQCLPKEEVNSYSCQCSTRYTGHNCEIDLDACASKPCPNGVPCHNLYNDFHCQCPNGFTGKTCQLRGDWDVCITQPCGPFGQCIPHKSSFICNCSVGFYGNFCSERVPKMIDDNWSLQSPELYVLFGVLLAALLFAILAIIVCRRQNRSIVGGKTNSSSHGDSNSDRLPSTDDPRNALIPSTPRVAAPIYQNTVERPPPPLPPKNTTRIPRSSNHTLLSSGLPTVEVRPMQSTHRLNGSNHICCPTPPQSSKGSLSSKGQNPYDETYEEPPKPAPPPHRFIIENEESSALLSRGVIIKTGVKKDKAASNPATSMSSLDNSSGDYLTMKPISKKKAKNSEKTGEN